MNFRKSILLSLCLAGFGTANLWAQQGQSAASGDIYGPGGSVSFTIGQADYVTTNGTGGTMTQGVQQPIEILVLTGIEQTSIQLNLGVYPNPATDYVVLSIKEPLTDQLSYLLYSTEGKILSSGSIGSADCKISLSNLSNSIYYIKVLNNNKEVKSFKIIKNK